MRGRGEWWSQRCASFSSSEAVRGPQTASNHGPAASRCAGELELARHAWPAGSWRRRRLDEDQARGDAVRAGRRMLCRAMVHSRPRTSHRQAAAGGVTALQARHGWGCAAPPAWAPLSRCASVLVRSGDFGVSQRRARLPNSVVLASRQRQHSSCSESRGRPRNTSSAGPRYRPGVAPAATSLGWRPLSSISLLTGDVVMACFVVENQAALSAPAEDSAQGGTESGTGGHGCLALAAHGRAR